MAANIASQSQRLLLTLVALMVGLHPVCSLLQPQPAAPAHPVFGGFLDTFLKGETDRGASALAGEMVTAMAHYYGNVPKSNARQISNDLKLGITGDTDLTATQITLSALLTDSPWIFVDSVSLVLSDAQG